MAPKMTAILIILHPNRGNAAKLVNSPKPVNSPEIPALHPAMEPKVPRKPNKEGANNLAKGIDFCGICFATSAKITFLSEAIINGCSSFCFLIISTI